MTCSYRSCQGTHALRCRNTSFVTVPLCTGQQLQTLGCFSILNMHPLFNRYEQLCRQEFVQSQVVEQPWSHYRI